MADEKESRISGIIKAMLSSIVGLLSGAVIMYLSPLVNNAIKPPKPVPNFSFAADGAAVTFNNRSTGGTQGWWDFGDGSALEPFAPNQASITHRFPGPGSYAVKLSLHNLIGDEVERSVPVRIDNVAPPVIEDFQVVPVLTGRARASKNPCAPATFRITGNLKDADLIIWSVDDHPLELLNMGQGSLEHYVTFASYGPKKIRLMAVSGKHRTEKAVDVWVDVPEDDPLILIQQTSYASAPKTIPISVSFPAQFTGASYPFEVSRRVGPDSCILNATFDQPNERLVRNPKLTIAADKKSFTVTGELLRQNAAGGAPASWFAKVEMNVANQATPGAKKCQPVSAMLQLPGRTVVALPTSTGALAGGIEWELREGMTVLYKDTKLPATQILRFKDQTYRVSVSSIGSQLQIDAVETGPTVPIINTSSPRP